jgi:hypothetical protein
MSETNMPRPSPKALVEEVISHLELTLKSWTWSQRQLHQTNWKS